jgi:flavin reductase (DIM6/NTAB) family NADH-FMN oxidoreductase RutF
MLAALPRSAGAASFKQGMRALVGGVTVIAAQDRSGACVGVTATAVTSLSAEPPSLLVCVNRVSSIAGALEIEAAFSVNVLTVGQADVAQAFGGQRGVRGTGKFAYGAWHRSEHGVLLLNGARVNFECVVAKSMDWATHHVVIGRVTDVHFGHAGAKPLVYGDGRYGTVE